MPENDKTNQDSSQKPIDSDAGHQAQAEPEHKGSIWTHPYVMYIWINLALFGILILMAYLGYKLGIIPNLS